LFLLKRPSEKPFNRTNESDFSELALGVTDDRRLGYALREIG